MVFGTKTIASRKTPIPCRDLSVGKEVDPSQLQPRSDRDASTALVAGAAPSAQHDSLVGGLKVD